MCKRKRQAKRMLSVMLIVMLTLSASSPVFAATARATTMKLEQTEGTVMVKTQNGASRKATKGMRLYNGNSVETQTKSYAFISLDNSKAVKLDEQSKASLRQNGKKLELLVRSGQLFFNVSTKLGKDESMNIRTSTMVTGIRGTCGVVEAVTPKVSRLYLLEGQVVLGGDTPVTIHGGETATIDTTTIKEPEVIVSDMKEKDIPHFAVEEVLKDSALQERIESNTDLSVEKMEEALEEKPEEEAPEEEKPEEETPEEEKPEETPTQPSTPVQPGTPSIPETPSEVNPPTGDNGDTGNIGDTGGTGDSSEEDVTEPEIPEEPTAGETLTGELKADSIETALSGNNVVRIEKNGTLNMIGQSITIPTGRTLIIDTVFTEITTERYKGFYMDKDSKIIVEPNATLYINGNIMGGSIELNDSTLYNKGTIDGQAMTASGNVTIGNNNIIKLQQAFTQTGTDTQVKYQGGSDSVFISNEASTAMPTAKESSGTLLACAVSGNSTDDAEGETVQFIYADYLNSRAADYMNQLSTKPNSNVTWNFSKDAVVAVGTSVTLSNLTADLGMYQVQVAGKLTLRNIESIVGNVSSMIGVKIGGHLILDRDPTLVNGTKHQITNMEYGHCVIGVEESLVSNPEMVTKIDWNDVDLVLQTLGNEPAYAIQGTGVKEQTSEDELTVASNSFVSVPDGYELVWLKQGLFLKKAAIEAAQ